MAERGRKSAALADDFEDGSDGRRKRVWTPEEDELLKQAVQRYGERAWAKIAEELQGRVGKQCRDRWCNHLSPDLDKKKWTDEEDQKLFEAVERMGNQWAEISRKVLPGRSDLSIKNRYYSKLRRDHRRAGNGGALARRIPDSGSSEQPAAVPATTQQAPAQEPASKRGKVVMAAADKAPKASPHLQPGLSLGEKPSGRKSNAATTRKPRGGGKAAQQKALAAATALLGASASTSPSASMFSSIMPQLGTLSAAAAAAADQQQQQLAGESNGGGHTMPFFPYGAPPTWGYNPYSNGPNPFFHHPYSPITSLSTTPVPSPPRSPSVHPVPPMNLASLPGLASLGPSATTHNLTGSGLLNSGGANAGAPAQMQNGQQIAVAAAAAAAAAAGAGGSVGGGESTSRPTSPSTFPLALPGAPPNPFFNNLWFPVGNNGQSGMEGGSGGVTPVSAMGGSGGAGAVLSQLQQQQQQQQHQSQKDGMSEGTASPMEFQPFANPFSLSRIFGSTTGSSPSSSPTAGPLSLVGANPASGGTGANKVAGGMAAPQIQPGDWFPTIGSRGLEYRQHFRPVYGPGDALMGDHLPPPALATPQPILATAASLLGVGGAFMGGPGMPSGGAMPNLGAMGNGSNHRNKRSPGAKGSKKSSDGSNTGRWSPKEHHRFEEAVAKYGTQDWSLVANHVKTRTIVQVRSHAQKYFMRKGDVAAGRSLQDGAAGAGSSSAGHGGKGEDGTGAPALDHSFDGHEVVEQALRSLEEGHAGDLDDGDDEDDGLPAEDSEHHLRHQHAGSDSAGSNEMMVPGEMGQNASHEDVPASPSGESSPNHDRPSSGQESGVEDSMPSAPTMHEGEALQAI